MYSLHKLATYLVLFTSPVRIVSALPLTIPAAVEAHAASTQTAPYKLTLDTANAGAITAPATVAPDFDTEVVAPLRAKQAAQAAAEAAQKAAQAAAKRAAKVAVTPAAATGDAWLKLRLCESGNTYSRNSGNGYYGAYQYSMSTWNNYGGFARPDLAPANVQDAKAQADFAVRGWSPWPSCGRQISQ
jgi:hypothetical protein